MRRISHLVVGLAAPLLLVARCGTASQSSGGQPAPPASATPAAELEPQWPDAGPAGVLAAVTTQHLADHDRIVFQFHGSMPPEVTISHPDQVTEDPSDRPVTLLGSVFVAVVFHGGRLDTAAIESDPANVVRYDGPVRLTPEYPLLRELAVSGDFEAVLSFGLGLSAVADVKTSTPVGSGTVIVDLWPDTVSTTA